MKCCPFLETEVKNTIKDIARRLDARSGGAVKRMYRKLQKAAARKQIYQSKLVVSRRVGSDLYRRIGRLDLVAFPNQLRVADSLWQDTYAIEKILLVCGLTPQQFDPRRKYDICLNWQDLTRSVVDTRDYVRRSFSKTRAQTIEDPCVELNFDCNDISKTVMGRINRDVFGYDLDIDPLEFMGRAVCKSDDNATHDGRIMDCPIKKSDLQTGVVYNVLVDNTDGDFVVDLRVIYIKGLVDFFYEKRRPLGERFSNTNSIVSMRELRDEFSDSEVRAIEKFCVLLGADYGELDVLRDKKTRRVYIVDFAKTPFGPPNGLPKAMIAEAVERMGIAFVENVLRANTR